MTDASITSPGRSPVWPNKKRTS